MARADWSRFDAVLGARRGSASAQATRDAKENQVREHAIPEMIAALNLSSGAGTAIDLLVKAHRSGGARAGTPEYEKLCKELIATKADGGWTPADVVGIKELATLAAHGDPVSWPGLTDPAVDALGAHFQALADDCEEGKRDVGKTFRAYAMTTAIEKHGNSLQYERLAPVLKGLAALLHHLPPHEPMAELLRVAPAQALAGPLQPLVQAFRRRIQDRKLSSQERRVLERMIEDQIRNGQAEEALRPITDVL